MENNVGTNATTPRFAFSIKNANATTSKNVAIFSGHLDFTEQIMHQQVTTVGSGDSARAGRYTDIAPRILNLLSAAGFPVDAVLATSEAQEGVDLTMLPIDSTKSIEGFKKYFRTNAHFIKNISIVASSSDSFNTTMNFANKMFPFRKTAVNEIDLSKYYTVNQYSQKKIEIPFAEGEVEISDQLWLDINIPANETFKITIELYD